MTINPMDDEEHDGKECDERDEDSVGGYYGDLSLHQHVLDEMAFLREAPAAPSSYNAMPPCQHGPTESSTTTTVEVEPPSAPPQPVVAADPVPSPASTSSSAFPMHASAPLLELSISDAELDLLISSLPMPSPECDDSDDDDSADAKNAETGRRSNGGRAAATAGSSSEMQWVLSFLTDPDDAAQHDAEAKSLLESLEKHDDDNYQYFLQELDQANLLLGANASSSEHQDTTSLSAVKQGDDEEDADGEQMMSTNVLKTLECDAVQALARLRLRASDQDECRQVELLDARDSADDPLDDDDDEDDDEDWEIVRRSMKTQATRPDASTARVTSSTSSSSGASIREDVLPPPAPFAASSRLSKGVSENSNDANKPRGHSQKNHRAALSQEIGDLLKTHGEFQFPKHMFPHHNDALELES